jgi:hypothetical protein
MPPVRRSIRPVLSAALMLVGLAGAPVHASTTSTIYIGGARVSTSTLHTVDPTTGLATLFGSTVGPVEGMSYDSTRDRIVATLRTSTEIKTIDPVTGAVGTLPTPRSADVRGLAYDRNRDLFWATGQTTGHLHTMGPVTGALTLAQPLPLAGNIRPGGLGFDPVNDILYAVDNNRLFAISVAGGAPYVPVAVGPVGFGVGFIDVDAVEYDLSTGKLFIVEDRDSTPNPLLNQRFAELDPLTGLAINIGSTVLPFQIGQGMAIIPVPEPAGLALALAAVPLLRRRRAR